MVRLFSKVMLVAAVGVTAAACQDSTYGAGPNTYRPAYGYTAGPVYATPAPVYYGRPAPAYYGNPYYGGQPAYYGNPYGNQPGSHGYYNQADGRRYTTVMVTNRGQNGNRDDVVRQQVVCGSQYYDGYRTQTAPSC